MKTFGLLAPLLFASLALATTPSVTLRYSGVFDTWCAQQTGVEIQQLERDRLIAVFPRLQEAWDRQGPSLLAKTQELTGKSFAQNEMIATVFLCKKTPSMSMPLLINANWFVKDVPQDPQLVVDIIFHELLHTYLVDNFLPLRSPLLEKYRDENPNVLAHLHLMALQKKVYLALGLDDLAARVIKFDSENYKGSYKRSWEIVNLEGEDRFVAELVP